MGVFVLILVHRCDLVYNKGVEILCQKGKLLMKKQRVQIRLDSELLDRIDQEATDQGLKRSEIIRKRLIHSYCNNIVYIDYMAALLPEQKKEKENENS